jgi:hypothetical protein
MTVNKHRTQSDEKADIVAKADATPKPDATPQAILKPDAATPGPDATPKPTTPPVTTITPDVGAQQTRPTLEAVVAPLQANVKTITVIVLTSVACLLLFGGVLWKLFVTPEWIDKQLGISDEVRKTLWKEVDSGYSTTVIFHNGNNAGDSSFEFYCEADQKAELFLTSDASFFPENRVPKIAIQLNGQEIKFEPNEITRGLPHTGPRDITDLLKGRGPLNFVLIVSEDANSYPQGLLVINVLVLVSNHANKP